MQYRSLAIEELMGMVFSDVRISHDCVKFIINSRKRYEMYHRQDCCESVDLIDVIGNTRDLIGSPIVQASEEINNDDPPPSDTGHYPPPESWTWSFYHISTTRGTVTFRWYGESNGYYSEKITLEYVRGPEEHTNFYD